MTTRDIILHISRWWITGYQGPGRVLKTIRSKGSKSYKKNSPAFDRMGVYLDFTSEAFISLVGVAGSRVEIYTGTPKMYPTEQLRVVL